MQTFTQRFETPQNERERCVVKRYMDCGKNYMDWKDFVKQNAFSLTH